MVNLYLENNADDIILGGFSTGNEPFSDLFYLHNQITIAYMPFKSDGILLLIDTSFEFKASPVFRCQCYNWSFLEDLNVMSYSEIPTSITKQELEFSTDSHASNDLSKLMISLRESLTEEGQLNLHSILSPSFNQPICQSNNRKYKLSLLHELLELCFNYLDGLLVKL